MFRGAGGDVHAQVRWRECMREGVWAEHARPHDGPRWRGEGGMRCVRWEDCRRARTSRASNRRCAPRARHLIVIGKEGSGPGWSWWLQRQLQHTGSLSHYNGAFTRVDGEVIRGGHVRGADQKLALPSSSTASMSSVGNGASTSSGRNSMASPAVIAASSLGSPSSSEQGSSGPRCTHQREDMQAGQQTRASQPGEASQARSTRHA